MRPVQPLPFELINPDTGEPLRREADVLSGLDQPARIIARDGQQIINFQPHCGIQNGFYYDSENALREDCLKPSGRAHSSCYKIESLRWIMRMTAPDSVIFDFGCHDCQVLSFFPENTCRIGVDISCESLFYRSPNALDSGVQHLWIANAARLPVPGACADIVLCCDIIEHMLEPEAILREAHRILKPGGRLVVTVPNLVHLANRLSVLLGYGGGLELAQLLKGKSPFISVAGVRFPDQSCHLRWFTNASLAKFVTGLGFDVTAKMGIGPIVSRLGISSLSRNLALLTAVVARKR